MVRPLLISLHIPKTAGTSFREALQGAFGGERLLLDYGHGEAFARLTREGVPALELHRRWLDLGYGAAFSREGRGAAALPQEAACVHGHFPAVKYLPALLSRRAFARRTFYMTWLREPLARMVSNYRYWRSLDPAQVEDPLVRQVLEEDWSLEAFCLSPALANYQSLWMRRVPRALFGFIGLTEFYEEDLARLSRLLMARGLVSAPLEAHRLNEGPQEAADPQTLDEARLAALRPAFERLHDRDMTLYRRQLARRSAHPAKSA